MNILDNFLKKDLIKFGSIIDKKKCKELHDKVFSSRDLSEGLFRSEKDFLSNLIQKKQIQEREKIILQKSLTFLLSKKTL